MTQKSGINLLVRILFSLITGFIISAMYFTGGTVDKFYNEGDVLEIFQRDINLSLNGIVYSQENNQYTVEGNPATMHWQSFTTENAWQYMDMNLPEISNEAMKLHLYYYNSINELVGDGEIIATEGNNWVQIGQNPFSYIVVAIEEQQGITFEIDYIKLRTEMPDASNKKILVFSLLFAIICFVICSMISMLRRKLGYSSNGYVFIVALQKLYMYMGNVLLKNHLQISEKKKSRLRIGLFVILFSVLSVMNVYGLYFKVDVHRYIMLFFVVILFAEAILYQNDKLKQQNWKNPFVKFWGLLWLTTCISDFVVTKRNPMFSFYGYVMLFVMGYLFFVWSNRGDTARIRREICQAVEWTFWLCTIYCLLCRPEIEGFMYNGFYINPNPFGLYMAVVICIFFYELDYCISRKRLQWKKVFLYIAGIDIAAFFLYKTRCMTGIAALLAAGIIWIFGYMRKGISIRLRARLLKILVALAVAFIPFFVVMQWGINTIPNVFHTTVVYPEETNYAMEDMEFLPEMGEIVYAADSAVQDGVTEESSAVERVIAKVKNITSINVLLSGRMYNYVAYFRDMNLFGHTKRPVAYGTNTNYAHNGILAYAHVYGLYVLIPYTLMNLYYLYYAFRYWHQGKGRRADAFLPLGIFVVFFLENMMDNVDIPFHWIVWFVFTFIGGTLFTSTSEPQNRKVDS